jgi:hypothetical protein
MNEGAVSIIRVVKVLADEHVRMYLPMCDLLHFEYQAVNCTFRPLRIVIAFCFLCLICILSLSPFFIFKICFLMFIGFECTYHRARYHFFHFTID